ncbi:MAG: DVUA0089 family protein [Pedobacter sp.]
MKNVIAVISVLLVLSLASLAGAVTYEYSGTFVFTSDVGQFDLHLANDATVHIYTDSWTDPLSGNFDPAIYLWNGSGVLIAESIDIDPITNWNDSLSETLSAGDYIITLVLAGNIPNNDLSLSEGFTNTQQDPITTYGLGYYHFFLDAVPVPEPSTFLLFAGGLLGVGMLRKKFKA